MKKLVKLSTLLLSIFFGMNIVKARSCEDLVMYANSDFWGRTNVYMNYAGVNYNYNLFTLKNGYGEAFTSYCRNAGISAGKIYNGQSYYCKQTVFDTTTTNETRKTYDAGVIAILKNGYSSRNNNSYSLAYNQEYVATNLALRVYEMLWPQINSNGSNNTGNNRAHKYYVNKWLGYSEIQELLKQSVGYVRSKYSSVTSVSSWTSNGYNVSSNIENEAYRLVKIGLQAAADYKTKGAASITWDEKPTKTKFLDTNDDDIDNYKMSMTYNFKVDKFTTEGAYVKATFNCSNCSKYGIKYTVYVNEKEISGASTGNLLKEATVSNGTGIFSIKVIFEGNSNQYNCEELKYSLDVDYYDETINTEAYDMYSSGCYSNSTCQHFYVLYADDIKKTANIDGSIELCTLNCAELEELCKNGNDYACERFESEYNSNCVECSAYVSNAECSDEESEIDIKEGYVVDPTSCDREDKADVLNCIINNEDQAGNSYKATELVSNKYCSVWCKEDYHFTLPGNQEVNSGRYFTLKASISGTKTCYTSRIDKETFNDDYEAARKEVINAYNEYLVHYNAVNNSTGSTTTTPKNTYKTYYDDTCTGTYTDTCTRDISCKQKCINKYTAEGWSSEAITATCKWETGTCTENYSCQKSYTYTCSKATNVTCDSYTNYKYTWSYKGYTASGGASYSYSGTNTTCSGGTCTYTSNGSHNVSSGSCTVKNGDPLETYYNPSTVASKLASLNAAINRLNTILNNYNSCSTWSIDYAFDPEVYFWYEESYMDNVLTDKLDTNGNISKGNVQVQSCASDTDNAYESCASGWSSNRLFGNEDKFLCTSSGCGWQSVSVGQAQRMKASISASGSYITPTQFYTVYPSGGVVVAEPGTVIQNSTELTNKLPVGLGTGRGAYTYALIVNNLGEYYNNDKLGRIWGDEDSVVSTALKEENNKCQETGALQYNVAIKDEDDEATYFDKGVYVCAYKVNCPDCPVECDPEDGCEADCDDGKCPVVCDNCIYNNNDLNLNYRPITNEDINPNDRDLGENWDYDDTIDTALELKAYVTTEEIVEDGETIYDGENYVMKVTLDSKMINKIREYNDKYEDKEGYFNNSLACYDHVNENDGDTYENVYCYSTFIDELLYDNDTKDNIKIPKNRIIGTDADSSDNLRKTNTQLSGYWTTWSEANWTIKTEHGLAYYNKKYEEIGIGPSWK